MAIQALEAMAVQVNQHGLPQLIDHDWLRPIGWAYKGWTERDGTKLRLLVDSLIPENASDWGGVYTRYRAFCKNWANRMVEPYSAILNSFDDPTIALTFDTDCVYLTSPGIGRRFCKDVFDRIDDDGLIALRGLNCRDDGWLRHGDFLLVPSPYFRLGNELPNPPNRAFLKTFFERVRSDHDSEWRISLDENLLGIPASLRPTEQRHYWWGPPFKGQPSKQPHGVTVHLPTKYDVLNGLLRTEFWWYGKEERTFEMEEVLDRKDIYSNVRNQRSCRFVHSIFNGSSDIARHLDGAVRIYDDQKWQARIASDCTVAKFGKSAKRKKLWRSDGLIGAKDLYNLLHMFFRGNFFRCRILRPSRSGCLSKAARIARQFGSLNFRFSVLTPPKQTLSSPPRSKRAADALST